MAVSRAERGIIICKMKTISANVTVEFWVRCFLPFNTVSPKGTKIEENSYVKVHWCCRNGFI